MDYSPDDPVAGFQERDIEKCKEVEKQFMAAIGYADSKEVILRMTATRVILENSRCENFDAYMPYLAMNYFDSFISRNPLPKMLRRVGDDIAIAANCCLMLAYKTKPDTFNVHAFLAKTKMIEHERHVLAVELVILKALKWNLEAVTAISFIDMVIPRIPEAENIQRRVVNEIIIQAQADITFTKFRPSVIAAAAIITACRLTLREMQPICYKWIVDAKFVNEVDLEAYFVKTGQMCIDKKIIKETDGQKPKSHRVRAASRRRSSDANTERKFDRPVKEEMSMARTKKKVLAVPENNIDDSESDDEMNFELK
ncbi:putative cyclin-D2-3 [Mangifera indica]|uniref:putative cyclin-D2-3 n=1 Tax=Mangifera indica TaxID=29780 RepID=UPI001CFA468D|nr:putative cyclin-D2-3 [Mangifera indica]